MFFKLKYTITYTKYKSECHTKAYGRADKQLAWTETDFSLLLMANGIIWMAFFECAQSAVWLVGVCWVCT